MLEIRFFYRESMLKQQSNGFPDGLLHNLIVPISFGNRDLWTHVNSMAIWSVLYDLSGP